MGESGAAGDTAGRERGSWRPGWEKVGRLETGLGESGAAGDRAGREWDGWRQGWERVGQLETGLGEGEAAGDRAATRGLLPSNPVQRGPGP